MSAGTQEVAATVRNILRIAEQTSEEAEHGRLAVQDVMGQMKQIGQGWTGFGSSADGYDRSGTGFSGNQ